MDMELDATTLDALLAFIDAHDNAEEVKLIQEDEATVTESKTGLLSDKKRTRSEEKRPKESKKHELERLRHEVQALQATLGPLKTKVVALHGRNECERRLQSLGDRKELIKAWERIADRQYDRRRASEDVNSRLRRRVAKQRSTMIGLLRIIRHQLTEATIETPAKNSMALPTWTLATEGSDARSFMERLSRLVVDMKEAYEGTLAWVRCARSLRSSGESSDVRLAPLTPHQIMIEVVDVRVLPFGFQEAGDACWHIGVNTPLCRKRDVMREETEVDGRNTVFTVQAIHEPFDAQNYRSIKIRRLASVQRAKDNDSQVILHAVRSQSVELQGLKTPTMTLTSQHWNIFQPGSMDSCVVTSSARILVQVEHGHSISKETCKLLTAYFADQMTTDMDTMSSHIEDHLFEQHHMRMNDTQLRSQH
ncbi:hypothetical protein Poli38472_007132 [Pythium oligandrum]|uniref:Uncharacterized protein n=1 Tax=Pythium oligandrum TaxID=41045 RepID=A0A8K1C9E2_PYTOL|nr:hypothetical protein Poli38472_007132 [Pythium oligandrum]|eukprot:TMW58987.1 hypothetical protein Poli38472_007132 [Pythium oligandrum]